MLTGFIIVVLAAAAVPGGRAIVRARRRKRFGPAMRAAAGMLEGGVINGLSVRGRRGSSQISAGWAHFGGSEHTTLWIHLPGQPLVWRLEWRSGELGAHAPEPGRAMSFVTQHYQNDGAPGAVVSRLLGEAECLLICSLGVRKITAADHGLTFECSAIAEPAAVELAIDLVMRLRERVTTAYGEVEASAPLYQRGDAYRGLPDDSPRKELRARLAAEVLALRRARSWS